MMRYSLLYPEYLYDFHHRTRLGSGDHTAAPFTTPSAMQTRTLITYFYIHSATGYRRYNYSSIFFSLINVPFIVNKCHCTCGGHDGGTLHVASYQNRQTNVLLSSTHTDRRLHVFYIVTYAC